MMTKSDAHNRETILTERLKLMERMTNQMARITYGASISESLGKVRRKTGEREEGEKGENKKKAHNRPKTTNFLQKKEMVALAVAFVRVCAYVNGVQNPFNRSQAPSLPPLCVQASDYVWHLSIIHQLVCVR